MRFIPSTNKKDVLNLVTFWLMLSPLQALAAAEISSLYLRILSPLQPHSFVEVNLATLDPQWQSEIHPARQEYEHLAKRLNQISALYHQVSQNAAVFSMMDPRHPSLPGLRENMRSAVNKAQDLAKQMEALQETALLKSAMKLPVCKVSEDLAEVDLNPVLAQMKNPATYEIDMSLQIAGRDLPLRWRGNLQKLARQLRQQGRDSILPLAENVELMVEQNPATETRRPASDCQSVQYQH